MLQHRQGNRARLAFSQGVLPTHHTLKLWEFTHHLAHQIVLAQVSGPTGMVAGLRRQSQLLQQDIGAPLQPLDAIQE